MNPLILYMASGESLYAGILVLLAVILLSQWMRQAWWRRLRMLATWVGLALVVMACPPLPWSFDAAVALGFVAWLALVGRSGRGRIRIVQVLAGAALAALLLIAGVAEWPRRYMPEIRGTPSDHLVVLGDSISAGIAGENARWPSVFMTQTGIPVKNLSQPGAMVADAQDWTRNLDSSDTLVLIEIGGNDLIAGIPSRDYDDALDRLLAATVQPGRTVVMFELPLLPHRIAYGMSQRRLAAKYHVTLIPKRYFMSVLSASNATSDGLHLSPEGAQLMAALVQRALGSAFKKALTE